MSISKQFEETLDQAGQGLERQMSALGLTMAVVTNVSDDQKRNRVKCLPVAHTASGAQKDMEETDWCPVMAPLGGKGRGQFFFPSVNDTVLLGYLGGDPHRPVVLGAYWDSQVTPPYTVEGGKVYNFSIRTPGGTELLFYDEPEKQRFTVTLPSGASLAIDDGEQGACLTDKEGVNALVLDLKTGEATLTGKTKVILSVEGTSITLDKDSVTVKAGSKITLEAPTVEGRASNAMSLEGSSSAELKGGAGGVTVQSSSTVDVKGPAGVNLN